MPFDVRIGDLFEATNLTALAHGCNCAGSMGRGIAVEFKRRWPDMYIAYRTECREGRFQPGDVFVWDAADKTIFNLATQPLPGRSARLEHIESSLKKAVQIAEAREIPVLAMPRIGAGLGGLNWAEVKPIIEGVAAQSAVVVAVYERETND